MFSKAKRFEIPVRTNEVKKQENQKKMAVKIPVAVPAPQLKLTSKSTYKSTEAQSQCSSVPSVKSFPKVTRPTSTPKINVKKTEVSSKNVNVKNTDTNTQDEIINAQEVEIRNKDYTISEYNKQIEDLKNEIAGLQKLMKVTLKQSNDCNDLGEQFSQITLVETVKSNEQGRIEIVSTVDDATNNTIDNMKHKIFELQLTCDRLEQEVSSKQVELMSLEKVIEIRDSLCKDLQDKLTNVETTLEETHQRFEMVKGHHALALEANESIRREYKVELETLKAKMEEEKQVIMNKSEIEQENIILKYNELIDSLKNQMIKERDETVNELHQELVSKDLEMKAKLDQINEATHEKLRLCEIQFEERTKSLQEHCSQQEKKVQYLEKEMANLKYSLSLAEEQNLVMQREINTFKKENESLRIQKNTMMKEIEDLKEESKKKLIHFENEINKLTVQIDKTIKEKNKFEMSLSVTRDIVQVLTMRLRESDNELEHLEEKVQKLTTSKELLENELSTYKNTLDNTIMECNEYKEALVNILRSKAALAKEHNRIVEHNVSLIETLQNVEKEAYREFGSIKNELIEDVELLKKEFNSQKQMLRDEVEKKRVLCELATEHAGQATAAAEQSRVLLAQAAGEIARLEADNQRYQQEIEDQQSLVVELSLLRQENEELAMTVAKQSSIIDKMKKDIEQPQSKPKSPSVIRKAHKIGKENLPAVISPLRERNHL